MSNEPKPQENPKPDVKPTDELADEQLDEVNGGLIIVVTPQPTLPAVQSPQVSPGMISSYTPPIPK